MLEISCSMIIIKDALKSELLVIHIASMAYLCYHLLWIIIDKHKHNILKFIPFHWRHSPIYLVTQFKKIIFSLILALFLYLGHSEFFTSEILITTIFEKKNWCKIDKASNILTFFTWSQRSLSYFKLADMAQNDLLFMFSNVIYSYLQTLMILT